jgi:hypothetical protein
MTTPFSQKDLPWLIALACAIIIIVIVTLLY